MIGLYLMHQFSICCRLILSISESAAFRVSVLRRGRGSRAAAEISSSESSQFGQSGLWFLRTMVAI